MLNDTARELCKNVSVLAKKLKSKKIKRHVPIEYSNEVRQITAQNRQELRRIKHKYKSEGKTYGQMYGSGIKGSLKDKTVELKGISHIMMPELVETISSNGTTKLDVTGMHWDFNRQLEKSGLYRLENIRELSDGSYIADMWYRGFLKPDNTFFPSNWPLEKVLLKIEEASNMVEEFVVKWNGSYSITGKTCEGVKIMSNISKRGSSFTHYISGRVDKL